MSKKITVAIAGLGSRGYNTYAEICKKLTDDIEIVAVAEPRKETMRIFRENFSVKDEMCFDTAEEMLKKDKLADVMFICTLDRMHYSQATAALRKGYDLLLEKPISVNPKECKEIADLANSLGRKVIVCHVLRYTMFYQTIKKYIDEGKIGEVMSIQAIERVCYWHQAHSFVRGNWRNSDTTSSMILQKCCHDMDIYLWLAGRKCVSVSSFGGLNYFNKDHAPEGATEHCSEKCSMYGKCVYNPFRYYGDLLKKGFYWPLDVVIPEPDEKLLDKALKEGPYGKCVFLTDNNVVDHQAVNLLLENGATINFTMSAFTAAPGRTMLIMGTKGHIEASMDDNVMDVCVFGEKPEHVDVGKLCDDFMGHGGGDGRMLNSLVKLFRDGVSDPAITTIDRSVESHYVAMAAEDSRANGGVLISMDEYVKSI